MTGAKVSDAYTVQSPDANGVGTMTNDPDPAFDDCSDANHTSNNASAAMTGQERRRPAEQQESAGAGSRAASSRPAPPTATRSAAPRHPTSAELNVVDYSPHHEPFQYYQSTSNPKHLPPQLGRRDWPDRPGQPPVRPDATSTRRCRAATCPR